MLADLTQTKRERTLNKFDGDFIQYNKKKVKEEGNDLSWFLAIHITLYVLVVFFAVFFIWFTVFNTTHHFFAVKGASMKSTLNSSISNSDGNTSIDAVYVNTTDKVEIFDVVVINRTNKESIIKRVMGLEGDYVTISKGSYTQNGEPFDTFFFYRISAEQMKTLDKENFDDEDAKLVEDNNQNGYSIYGYKDWAESNYAELAIKYETTFYDTFINGKDTTTDDFFVSKDGLIYVKVPEGKFFALGDNRGHSSDSTENGFYSVSNIDGVVEIVVYNYNFASRLWEVVKYYFSEAEKFFAR